MTRLDRFALVALLCTGCPDGHTSAGADGSESSSGTEAESTSTGDTEGSMCVDVDPGGFAPQEPNVPADCDDVLDRCKKDQDRDGIVFACDNAPDVANPAQRDLDGDGFGDAIDLCPVIAGESDDQLDSDRDGVGNACDRCAHDDDELEAALEAAGVPYVLWPRPAALQSDSDADGIGDACDACPLGADASCDGAQAGVGVGPVGFGDGDDLDQDGLANSVDACPRLVVAPQACSDASECPADAECTAGRCNHADADHDLVGNACDTCPTAANPGQVASKDAAYADDPDHDLIGNACESTPACGEYPNRRPIGFFDVAVDGYCCVQTSTAAVGLVDPDGVPLAADCSLVEGPCRELPAALREQPGVGTLPPGCAELLDPECRAQAIEVTLEDMGGDLDALWSYACMLPPRDSDFDAITDECDFCSFAFDPDNTVYVDANGREWPSDGKYCNGDYSLDSLDPANGCVPE